MLLLCLFHLSKLIFSTSCSVPTPAPVSEPRVNASRARLPNPLEELSSSLFNQSLIAALSEPDASLRLIFLMQKRGSQMSSRNPTQKYHYAFLANATIDAITSALNEKNDHGLAFEHPQLFATKVYNIMHQQSREHACQARKALREIDQNTYNESIAKDYHSVIDAYFKSEIVPLGLEQLEELISNALLNPQLSSLSDLQKLKSGSFIYNPLFCYILQKYRPYKIEAHDLPFFWRSLLFSSIHEFARIFPALAQQITSQKIAPFDPFSTQLPQQNPIFSDGIVNATKADDSFEKAASWGHTHTVRLFYPHVAHRQSLDRALEMASSNGHKDTVDLLLKNIKFSTDPTFYALEKAAFNDHDDIVELLLQTCPEITAHHAGHALVMAAFNGHKDIAELLFQMRPDITGDNVSYAIEKAARYGHKEIVAFLLEKCPGTDVKSALRDAAFYGHNDTVTFFLEKFPDTDGGEALENAALNGHKEVVESLLSHPRITAVHAGVALEKSAFGGHKDIVELLLPRVTDLSHLGRALRGATIMKYYNVAVLIQKRVDNISKGHCIVS